MNAATSENSHLSGLGQRMVLRCFGEPHLHLDGDAAALAFAADGTLWSVEEPGVLRQWSASGRPLGRFFLQDLETLWCFGPNAQLLASGNDELVVWETDSHQLLAKLDSPVWITAVAFHPTRSLIATGHDDGTIRFWDLAKDKPLAEFGNHASTVSALAFSTDGSRLASAGEDRQIQIWTTKEQKLVSTLTGHTDRIPALTWRPGENTLISAGWDATARVWDTTTGEPVMLLNTHADQVHLVSFSPDGQTLATADSAPAVHVWSDPLQAKVRHVLPGYSDEVRALAFSDDGKMLAVGGTDRVIHIWDTATGKLLAGQSAEARYSIDLCAGNGRNLVMCCGGNAGLRVWDADNGDERPLAAQVGFQHAVACSPDGRSMATAGPDSVIHLWDTLTLTPKRQLQCPRAPTTVLAFSPDSKILGSACVSEGTVWLWNPETGDPVLLIPEAAEGCSIESLAFHPAGRLLACGGIDWLATSGADGAVSIWDYQKRTRLDTIPHGSVSQAFSPDGRWLAVASLADRILIWDSVSRSIAKEVYGPRDQRITSVGFSPDGRWLIAGGDDCTLRLWAVADWKLHGLREVDSPVRALSFAPDGRRLFTANGNTTCCEIDLQKLIEPD